MNESFQILEIKGVKSVKMIEDNGVIRWVLNEPIDEKAELKILSKEEFFDFKKKF